MEENRDLWNAWSDAFQAAWNADVGPDELPPAPIGCGPGWPADRFHEPLPALDGTDVAVLGCGGGQEAVGFAHEGASVVGVDFSTRQLDHARRLRSAHGVCAVDLLAGDVTNLPLVEDRFDLVFSSWVLQMVEDLHGCFAEADRILRDDGIFVFAVPHPFYELFDPEAGELARSYFDSTPERRSIGDLDPDMTLYHHTVGEYHRALVEAGFTVERLYEPGSDDPDEYEEHWSQKPELMANVPPTLVVRAVV